MEKKYILYRLRKFACENLHVHSMYTFTAGNISK